MRVLRNFIFLTLVLILTINSPAWAAPKVTGEIDPVRIDMTPIPGPVWPHHESPYNYALYGGIDAGNFFENDEWMSTSVFGFRFSVEQDPLHRVDYNAEVTNNNLIGVHMGQRFFWDTDSDFRPYFKFSGGFHLRGSDGLVNLVEIKRLQLRASLGADRLFSDCVFIEGGVAAAVVGFEYFAVLGINLNL